MAHRTFGFALRWFRMALLAALIHLPEPNPAAAAVPFDVIARSRSAYGWPPVPVTVVRSAEEFQTLWRELGYLGSPPEFDFRKRMLVAYRMGHQPGPGSSLTIDAVEIRSGTMRLLVREVFGNRECGGGTVLEAPAIVISTVRWPGPVEADRQSEVGTCEPR